LTIIITLAVLLYFFLFFSNIVDRTRLVHSSVAVFSSLIGVLIFFVDSVGIEFVSVGLSVGIWLYFLGTLFYGHAVSESPSRGKLRPFFITNIVVLIFSTIVIYARAYYFDGIADCASKAACKDMWSAFYFSVATWTTLGYGDLSPKKEFYMTAASEAMLGYVGMSIVIGIVTAKLTKLLDE